MSGLYLHAYDWPFISEEEYKSHLYPWSLTPGRTADKKDNNPWNAGGTEDQLIWGWAMRDFDGDGEYTDSVKVRIGNGEAMDTGDPDGDGVMGEDWYNGYDDDGDGLIDEDYFIADGIDNGGIPCTGDSNEDGCYCCSGDYGVDENIDGIYDLGIDGVDNDHNGIIDDEAGDAVIDSNIKAWGSNIENNILIEFGRQDSLINGEVNPYYIPNLSWEGNGMHLLGSHRYNEEKVTLEFDIFTYDFGDDGIPGDPYIDLAGDGIYYPGESLHAGQFHPYYSDCGLDGICQYLPETPFSLIFSGIENPEWTAPDADGTEGDGIMQSGDTFISDNGDGIWEENEYIDVWPPANGVWDEGEIIFDCGQDGLCPEDNGYIEPDPGEEDGIFIAWDSGENDGVFDTGDGLYAFAGEPFDDFGLDGIEAIDLNGDGVYDQEGEIAPDAGENDTIRQSYEAFTDTNNDGLYNAPDLIDNYQFIDDVNGDGLSDYPDFEIDNRKVEFRIDYDPNPDFNMTLQTGYSWTKTQQVTGTGRYIADGFEYKFYQLRSRYKNWFSQFYMNESFSGNTRGYLLGNRIIDKSKNYAFQIQNNFNLNKLNTKLVWGMDYFRTEPKTFGTILNDGPNGYDNDGDDVFIKDNGVDDDGDGMVDDKICPDGEGEGFRYGKYWHCTEGIDEPDEFVDPTSNEYGIYYQSTTELFGTSRYEFITAARFDYHDLLDEGVLFAPKLGFIYKPDSKSSMRFTYGKAHNTPNSITLFTDLFITRTGNLNIYLRGNKDGTPYCREGEPCFGNEVYSVVEPGFYSEDGNTYYKMGTLDNSDYFTDYNNRVRGAPYFYKLDVAGTLLSGDMLPLDTSVYVIFVPEINGDGVLYTPEETINLPDVDPIKTEKIQTIEFGYKGFLGNRTHFSLDYYLSFYEDFFSPPTIITPLIVNRQFDDNGNDITTVHNFGSVAGLMPINDIGTHPPYGTAWNGLDDDEDWDLYADEFGWRDDKNGDCPDGAGTIDPCWADPGEWGIVMLEAGVKNGVAYDAGQIFHPYEFLYEQNGYPALKVENFPDLDAGKYLAVGVDEFHGTTGLSEYELVQTGLYDSNGEPIISGHGNASNITDLVLSPMNYGEVWMQGLDFGLTHFLTENIIIDGNFSWYGTTEFYNELTKKNDPINAPKWKWNASIKGTSAIGDFIVNFRHVDKFKWSDGIWAGIIGPYNIIDLFYTYHITDNLDFNLSALNLNNDLHRELVGGAVMGRQIVMRFTSTF
jgi:hypothetical protein